MFIRKIRKSTYKIQTNIFFAAFKCYLLSQNYVYASALPSSPQKMLLLHFKSQRAKNLFKAISYREPWTIHVHVVSLFREILGSWDRDILFRIRFIPRQLLFGFSCLHNSTNGIYSLFIHWCLLKDRFHLRDDLPILVSHFYLLRDERKGRESTCVKAYLS